MFYIYIYICILSVAVALVKIHDNNNMKYEATSAFTRTALSESVQTAKDVFIRETRFISKI